MRRQYPADQPSAWRGESDLDQNPIPGLSRATPSVATQEGEIAEDGYALDVVVSAGEDAPATTSGAELAVVQPRRLTGDVIDQIMELFEGWMELYVADGKASSQTFRAYRTDVRQHLEWLAEQGLMPSGVDEEAMVRYRRYLLEYADEQGKKRWSVSSVQRKLVSVRRFYTMAHAKGFVPTNPTVGVRSPKDKTDRAERIKYLTLAALQRLFAAPGQGPKGVRDRAILVAMTLHGLRVCEVANANIADLDLEAGEAGTLRVMGKGSKWRTVLLTEETREEIRKWLAVRALTGTTSEALFVSMNWGGESKAGERLGVRGIREMVDGYLTAVGVKREHVSCHSLRHSYATQSLAAGADLMAISKSMGHASVVTTQVYAQIVDAAKKNPAKFLVGSLL
jgi:integrase/recombinase XerD